MKIADIGTSADGAGRLRVLIAGCGTGLEIMRVAYRYAHARVLAVDFSGASLGYAKRKVREYGLTNIDFLKADIRDLGLLRDRFDLIESFGVLHHMADPAKGLEVLTALLGPRGLLSIGLYSEIGRRPVIDAHAYIKDSGYPCDLHGIRQLRRDLMADRRELLDAVLSPASDFWTTSDCRDLLFHVHEHRFTLLQIKTLLEKAGLNFLGLEFSNDADRVQYCSINSASDAMRNLTALHQFETEHPDVFGDTYRIWAQPSRQKLR